MSLFRLEDIENGNSRSKGAKIAVPNQSDGVVNVVRDYPWTLSPKTSRKDVPYMTLVERRITNNVLLQQTLYNISAIIDEGQNTPEDVINFIKDKLKLEEGATNNQGLNTIEKQSGVENENPTSPYSGLYDLDDTGWEFVLPYFNNSNHSIRNSWGDAKQGGLIGKGAEMLNNLVQGGASDFNTIMSAIGTGTNSDVIQRVGTYVERAKQYKFEGNGPSYSVQFELFNTSSIEDVINNWQLCFLLIYNTLPNRRSKTTFDPPPLYEVEIPGVRKSPATFINSLRVDFLGNTRIMDLDLSGALGEGNTNSGKFRTIVPDAYSITINFEDILPESKNFMNAMVDPDVNISVEFDQPEREKYDLDSAINTNKNDITYISLSNNQNAPSVNLSRSTQDNLYNPSVSKGGRSVNRTKSTINKNVDRGNI